MVTEKAKKIPYNEFKKIFFEQNGIVFRWVYDKRGYWKRIYYCKKCGRRGKYVDGDVVCLGCMLYQGDCDCPKIRDIKPIPWHRNEWIVMR